MDARLPAPLRPGDTIAVTAPSSGVGPELHRRLDVGISHLRRRGFEVLEGVCLRDDAGHHVSASKEARAAELMAFLVDPDIAAVVPPWGGETGIDLLSLLDFDLHGLGDAAGAEPHGHPYAPPPGWRTGSTSPPTTDGSP